VVEKDDERSCGSGLVIRDFTSSTSERSCGSGLSVSLRDRL